MMTNSFDITAFLMKSLPVIILIIAIILETLIHKHIIELYLPIKWRLAIYFNLFAI